MLGIGRLAATLYQPASAVRRAFGAVLTAATAASGLVAGGWRAALALAATVLAVLAAVLWILSPPRPHPAAGRPHPRNP